MNFGLLDHPVKNNADDACQRAHEICTENRYKTETVLPSMASSSSKSVHLSNSSICALVDTVTNDNELYCSQTLQQMQVRPDCSATRANVWSQYAAKARVASQIRLYGFESGLRSNPCGDTNYYQMALALRYRTELQILESCREWIFQIWTSLLEPRNRMCSKGHKQFHQEHESAPCQNPSSKWDRI